MSDNNIKADAGCAMKTTISKLTYEFRWSIENFSKWPPEFKLQSEEFQVAGRTFYAIFEKGPNTRSYEPVLSLILKRGADICVEQKFSVLDRDGGVSWEYKLPWWKPSEYVYHIFKGSRQSQKTYFVDDDELVKHGSNLPEIFTFKWDMRYDEFHNTIQPSS